eukprot:CAMPEP_0181186632 /NCGR_PEP_ID=MMETSP1096-20121128/10136_1 /TAXON_ID=156174 ORGANISM="Chrysochromulina ericina, Strain CCMP281" /NCGR_SAMPLE_ID=MMETSP1096 /ASSEMBLY_ACC=CAM_ASM_000453 /LENGTH=58 /DNA_ID=CAMNT_0023275539 /DNA_START=571 /DNA_END=748 /DNA_ORIENTATION=-
MQFSAKSMHPSRACNQQERSAGGQAAEAGASATSSSKMAHQRHRVLNGSPGGVAASEA